MIIRRSYPPQFGRNLLRAFEEHISNVPATRDLRFKPQFNKTCSELEQFDLLPMGDLWEEACLLDVMTYLMTSKKCRPVVHSSRSCLAGSRRSGSRACSSSTPNTKARLTKVCGLVMFDA